MKFKLGDNVTWTSSAASNTRTKIGSIIEVVHAGHRPKKKKKDNGRPRNHESYVVRAFTVMERRSKIKPQLRVYWPRVSQLTSHSDA